MSSISSSNSPSLPLSSLPSSLSSDSSVSVSLSSSDSKSSSADDSSPIVCYKLLARVGLRYYSIFDGLTEYRCGEPLCQSFVSHSKSGGFYAFPTAEQCFSAAIPNNSALFAAPRVLAQLECSGKQIHYRDGSIRFERVVPTQFYDLGLDYFSSSPSSRRLAEAQLNQLYRSLPPFRSSRDSTFRHYRERIQLAEAHKKVVQYQLYITKEVSELLDN